MACMSCAQRAAQMNVAPIPIVPATCVKTILDYQTLLTKVETQLTSHSLYNVFVSVVKSQINVYDQNCGLFEQYIEVNIEPLII